MLSRFVRASVLALFAILLGVAPAFHVARAQSDSCISGLSAEDCQLLADALTTTTSTLTSASFKFEATGKAEGVPQPTMASVDFSAKSEGAIDIANFLLQATAEYSLKGGAAPQADSIEVRIVDDQAYVKSEMMSQGKWIKSGSKVTAEQKAQMKLSTLHDVLMSPQVVKLLSEAASIPGFITASVEDATSVDGEASRLYTFNFDLAAFLKSPAGQKVIADLLKQQAATMSALSPTLPTPGPDEVYQQQVNALVVVFGPVLADTKLQAVVEIGADSQLFQGGAIVFSTKAQAALVSSLTKTNATTDFSAEGTVSLVLSGLNEEVTVEPVTDATVQ